MKSGTELSIHRLMLNPVLMMLAIAAFLGAAAPAGAVLGPATNFPTGGSPRAVAVADFTGDGKADIATADSLGDAISILPGDGSGGFGMKIDTTVGDDPRSLSAGDVNGDGKADLAVGNFAGTSAFILLGEGDGTFEGAIAEGTGTGVSAVLLAELVDDADLDFAVVNYSTGKVSVFEGLGNGGFGSPVPYTVESQPLSIGAADLNGDGRKDMAVGNSGGDSISVVLSTGGGTSFGPTVRNPTSAGAGTGLGPNSITTADLNSDGKIDLATANTYSDDVSVLAGTGNGTFGPARVFPAGEAPEGISTGNLTNDPKPDLVAAIPSTNLASVLPGDGLGAFATPQNFVAAGTPRATWTGDLNGDGNPDLLVANSVSDSVSVLLSRSPAPGFNPASLDFTSRAAGTTSAARTVTVSNSAGDPLKVSGVSIVGDDAADFRLVSDTCVPATIPSLGSCGVEVRFAPRAAGAKSADLRLDYNGTASPRSVPITGTAVAFSASVKCRVRQKRKKGNLKSIRVSCRVKPAAAAGKKLAWKLKKGEKVLRKGRTKARAGRLSFSIPGAGRLKKGRYGLSVGGMRVKSFKVR